MIKSKKSKGEIAGAFWKAAAAATAFKPRPGGAAERLRQNVNKSNDGPDGITSVVPAPPRPASSHKTPEPTAVPAVEPPAKSNDRGTGAVVPELKVSGADGKLTNIPTSLKDKKKEEISVAEESQRAIVTGNDAKYLSTLGIASSILDKRTNDFTKWLDYFGWVPGDKMRSRNFDEMRADLDRELNKAQAGGWLARFQEEDERVEGIKRGIDLAISECDELDNLLTLYSVELSVSDPRCRWSESLTCLQFTRLCRMILHTSRHKAKVCRCRRPTRSCSRRNSSPCCRLPPSANEILTL